MGKGSQIHFRGSTRVPDRIDQSAVSHPTDVILDRALAEEDMLMLTGEKENELELTTLPEHERETKTTK